MARFIRRFYCKYCYNTTRHELSGIHGNDADYYTCCECDHTGVRLEKPSKEGSAVQ